MDKVNSLYMYKVPISDYSSKNSDLFIYLYMYNSVNDDSNT